MESRTRAASSARHSCGQSFASWTKISRHFLTNRYEKRLLAGGVVFNSLTRSLVHSLSSKVSLQDVTALTGVQFADGFLLDLTHTLAGEMELIADLLQRLFRRADTEELT